MATPAPDDRLSRGGLAAAAVVLVVAVGVLIAGNAPEAFRPEPSGRPPDDVRLPVGVAPEGVMPTPPAVFRWEPGGEGVDAFQVVLFDDRRDRVWQSPPLTETEITVDPAHVFANAAAGRVYSWNVREFADGRPRATSAFVQFSFDVDVHGRGIGESIPQEPLLGQ